MSCRRLTRPEQPLYELAKPPNKDARRARHYRDVVFSRSRFELDRTLDDDLRKLRGHRCGSNRYCAQIQRCIPVKE